MAVPLLDLKAQHATIREEVVKAMMRVVDDQAFILGSPVTQLEGEVASLSRTRFAIGCANGTDAILIAVPTPLTRNREPDLSLVLDVARKLAGRLRPGHLVVLESTTYPGTTRDELLPILSATGLEPGRDFFLAFSPERVDPGRTDWTTRTTPRAAPTTSRIRRTTQARTVAPR